MREIGKELMAVRKEDLAINASMVTVTRPPARPKGDRSASEAGPAPKGKKR